MVLPCSYRQATGRCTPFAKQHHRAPPHYTLRVLSTMEYNQLEKNPLKSRQQNPMFSILTFLAHNILLSIIKYSKALRPY